MIVPFAVKKQENTRTTEAKDAQVAAHFSADPYIVELTNPSNVERQQLNINVTSTQSPGKVANTADSTSVSKVE